MFAGDLTYLDSDFNPRTRVGCDAGLKVKYIVVGISIHAPGWGATTPGPHFHLGGFISIHAPGWGATRNRVTIQTDSGYFNPRTRVGCDAGSGSSRGRKGNFNPRTRVGCDLIILARCLVMRNFNPRTRVGCDKFMARYWNLNCRFQSTHPGGVRHAQEIRFLIWRLYFNPRTRVGCDYVRSPANKP